MISVEPAKLWLEIRNAEEARNSIISSWKRQIAAYTGPYYSGSETTGEPATFEGESANDPNNHAFQFTSWMLPQLVYHNPKWVVKANKTGPTEIIAKAHKHALDRWSRDEKMAEKLQMVATDFLNIYGVMTLTMEDVPGVTQKFGENKGKPSRRPVLSRIPPDRYIRDPQATSKEGVEFEGHSWLTTKEELLKRAKENPDEGWNTETIEGLSEGVGVNEQFKNRRDDFWDIERKQFAIYDIWVKKYEDDDHPGPEHGFNGEIFTIAVDQAEGEDETPKELRKPRPFYGRPEGPYHVADVYPVSNEPYRLAPIVAIESQTREWNRLSRGINKSAGDYKRLILVNSAHEELSDIIAGGEHDLVIPIPGLDKDEIVVNLEIGGVTQEMLATEARAKDIVDRASGFNEAAQGQISGRSTATEAQLVEQNSDTRTDFPILRFHQFVGGIGCAVARYFWYENEVQFALGPEVNQDLGVSPGDEVWFEGGDNDPESGLTFDDLEFDIEPMSMRRVSESAQQQQAQAVMAGATQIAQLASQMPWLDSRRLAQMYGDALNIPEFAELVDYDVAAQIGMQGMMQEAVHGEQPKAEFPGPSGAIKPGGNQGGGARPQQPQATKMLQPQAGAQGVIQ